MALGPTLMAGARKGTRGGPSSLSRPGTGLRPGAAEIGNDRNRGRQPGPVPHHWSRSHRNMQERRRLLSVPKCHFIGWWSARAPAPSLALASICLTTSFSSPTVPCRFSYRPSCTHTGPTLTAQVTSTPPPHALRSFIPTVLLTHGATGAHTVQGQEMNCGHCKCCTPRSGSAGGCDSWQQPTQHSGSVQVLCVGAGSSTETAGVVCLSLCTSCSYCPGLAKGMGGGTWDRGQKGGVENDLW